MTPSYYPPDTSSPILDTTIGGILRTAAEQAPDQVALIEGSPDPAQRREWRYAQLLAEAECAAHALRARFGPGERIAVWAGNCPE
jgi:fatty-acyl-CoA synthase